MENNTTFPELCEKLRDLDEITLMEILNLRSEDLVDRFQDIIEEEFDRLLIETADDECEEY